MDALERRHHLAERFRLEHKLYDDAEVPAAAAQGPEQVRVLRGRRLYSCSVGRHYRTFDERVDG